MIFHIKNINGTYSILILKHLVSFVKIKYYKYTKNNRSSSQCILNHATPANLANS